MRGGRETIGSGRERCDEDGVNSGERRAMRGTRGRGKEDAEEIGHGGKKGEARRERKGKNQDAETMNQIEGHIEGEKQ